MGDFKCKFDENLLGIRKVFPPQGLSLYEVKDFADDVEQESKLSYHNLEDLSESILTEIV